MFYNNSGSVYTLNANEKQKYLGFSVGEYSFGTTLMSNQVCDFSGTNIIRLTTDIPIISSNTDNYSQNVLNDIYITEEFGQLIHYENEIRIKTRTNAIQEARFRLLDENGDELELNGRDWNMKLVLQSNDK